MKLLGSDLYTQLKKLPTSNTPSHQSKYPLVLMMCVIN
jgi:hypothetical protein